MTKLTRHNGRTGKDGAFNPKHNDRKFDLENADHIDQDLAKENIYWDYMQGYHNPIIDEHIGRNPLSFEEVERAFYYERYCDYCDAQNERNRKTGHSERDRRPEDLRADKRYCPEETILQIGTMEDSVSYKTLFRIAEDYFEEFEKRFGEYVHIIDWSLHVDEATPHIHERHVFDCPNRYGEIMPQQEKALEALGFELPFPDKKPGKLNNRKISFDKACRVMLFDICEKHGLHLDKEPEYGDRKYLEKTDFIIKKQEEKLEALTVRIEDTEKFIEEVSEVAYESAVKAVKDKVIEETHNADFDMIAKVKKELLSREDYSPTKKTIIKNAINRVLNRFKGMSEHITERLNKIFGDPVQKEKMKKPIKESILKTLAEKQKIVDEEKKRGSVSRHKQNDIGL
ncbi:MAG: serine/arginine repetitive matrix protein 2 [Lachnospiraceae bacterium]|nr:serine/arginine repetitive matrix protein 2 [Lachnospiraceae bacterium]